ncbi:MAG: ferrous iron transport protein A [Planctomycetes bacterium]|nr:ferrous iron transport protein A [Planctomycetota bacterium]
MTTLVDLPHGAPARVQAFSPGSEHALALMQLGLVPGTRVTVIRRAPLGDPLEVDVMGARLALRRAVAAEVLVETLVEVVQP